MSDDLISRQVAIELCDWYEHDFSEVEDYFKLFNDELKKLPSADVVEVVRCKDCTHAQEDRIYGGIWCKGDLVHKEHYCSYGERRTDAEISRSYIG